MKKVFITGGTSGIGWALAQLYLSKGYCVGIASRNPYKEICNFSEYTNLKVYTADTTDKEDLRKIMSVFASNDLAIVIANAGYYIESALGKISYKDSKTMLDINIRGTLNTMEIASDIMIKKGGKIAVVASVSALLDYKKATIYSKTKRTITVLADTYRRALQNHNIQVITICPGYVATPKLYALNENDLSKKQYVITANKAASIIYKGIKENRELIVFPKKMYNLISFLNLLPKFLLERIMYQKAKWQKRN